MNKEVPRSSIQGPHDGPRALRVGTVPAKEEKCYAF
jgi:hypothetical protein